MSTDTRSKQEIAASLLAEYKEADDAVTEQKKLLDEANKTRSEIVKRIHDALGKGPFVYQDNHLGKIVVRGNTYFFRGKNDEGTIKVG